MVTWQGLFRTARQNINKINGPVPDFCRWAGGSGRRRGRPLTDRLAVVELIAATTTQAGLKVESALDSATYEKGIKVSNAEIKTLDIQGDAFHPEWNYTIRSRSAANRCS